MTQGVVSALIPVFNGEGFLGAAIESAVDQHEPSLEVIVVDDGSTDSSADIALQHSGVTVLKQANGGIGAARNAAVANSKGDLLAFLDADDLWPLGRLAALKRALASQPEVDAVFGQVVQFGEGREDTAPERAQLAGTMLIRRRAFDRVGPFSESLKVGEFIDWWARAQEQGLQYTSIPEVVLRRRIHTTNTGIVHADSRVDYTRVLRAALERRRGVN